MSTASYPVFLRLAGRRVLLVGGGRVAAQKLPALLAAGAAVRVVAPEIGPTLRRAGAELHARVFAPADLDGCWFAVAAAPGDVNRQVAAEAEARGIFVNAVDDAAHASAYLGGVLQRAGVTIAVATDGQAPALAGLLREGLEALLPDDLERWLDTARAQRTAWLASGVPMPRRRPLLLEALVQLYAARPVETVP